MSFAGPTWASCSLRGLPLPSPSSSSALLPSASALVHRVELSLRYWCCQPMRREARNLCRAFFYRSWSQTQGCEPTSSLISRRTLFCSKPGVTHIKSMVFLGKRIVCFVFTSRMEKECTSCDITNAALSHHGVVIRDPLDLEKKKRAIRSAGLSKLQVIADFDMTLTKYKVNGERGQSSHALLHQGNAEYDLKRRQLFNHYYPLEVSSTIPVDEKTKLMEEWWEKTHSLLIEGGLNHAAIVQSVKNAVINFRDGVVELFELLESSGVPLLIFSAGLADIIEEVMRQKLHRTFGSIRVVSNRMEFDSTGKLLGFKGKTIHVLNKNEHALELAAPLSINHKLGVNQAENGVTIVQGRKNVLLLGDHLGDLGMSDGVDFENRISVGFLNENVEDWLETYKQAFDIVVLNDGSMSHVVDLVREFSS